MKILHKYVLKEHLGPFVFALAALTSILLLNYIAKRFGDLVGKGIPWTVIAEFFALSVPFTVALTLPMAVLVAVLYAFSRLAADNEITALKASGVAMLRLLTPVLLTSVGVTALMLFFNDQILPRTNHALAVLQSDIAQTKPTFALREQVINEVSPGKFYIRANHIDEGSNRMREVTIYDMGDPARRRTIYADSGTLAMAGNRTDLLMTLHNGVMQDVPTANPAELQRLFFRSDAIQVKGVANQFRKSTTGGEAKGDREMSVCEMQRAVEQARRSYAHAAQNVRTGLARARMFHVKVDPSVARVRFASEPRVTLGGAYCALLRKLGVPTLGAQGVPPVPRSVRQTAQDTQPRGDTQPGRPERQGEQQGRQGESTPPAPGAPPRAGAATGAPRNQPGQTVSTRPPYGETVPRPALPPPRSGPVPPSRVLPTLRAPQPGPRPLPPTVPPAIGRMMIQQQMQMMQGGPPPQLGATPGSLEGEYIHLKDLQSSVNDYEVEIHKKFALAVACFVFVLLGAPVALRFPRAGVGLTIGVSLFVFALYYVGLIAGASLGSRGIIPPWVSMWAPNVIFGTTGVVLVARMNVKEGSLRGGGASEWLYTTRAWFNHTLRGVGALPERRRSAA